MVTYKVIWERHAKQTLREIFEYLRWRESISVARRVVNQLIATARTLEKFPTRHPKEPNLGHLPYDFRFCTVWNYKIIFEITDTEVFILEVFHTSRNPHDIKDIL